MNIHEKLREKGINQSYDYMISKGRIITLRDEKFTTKIKDLIKTFNVELLTWDEYLKK